MMAKLSVYIPDELLEKAKEVDPEMRMSQVVQDALRTRVGMSQPRPFAELNDELRRQRDLARQLVKARVTEAYQQGYAVGLAFADLLPWIAFEDFSRRNWNLLDWNKDFDESEFEAVAASEEDLAKGWTTLDFESALDDVMAKTSRIPTETEGSSLPVGVSAEGFVDAIRDVWTGAQPDAASDIPEIAGSGPLAVLEEVSEREP